MVSNTTKQVDLELLLKAEKAKKDFKEFVEDMKTQMKVGVNKSFASLSDESFQKVSQSLSKLATKGLDTTPYQKFFDKLEKMSEESSKAISSKYVGKFQSIYREFEKGGKNVDDLKRKLTELQSKCDRDVQRAIAKVGLEIDTTGKKMVEASKKTSILSRAFEGFGNRLKTYFSYKIINSVTQAVGDLARSAVDLESQFANIQAITSASDATMSNLRDTILKVGESSKYTTEQIAESTVMLGQAGLSAEQINDVLETTTQLAAATGSELSNTVDLMTSALAVWGLNSEEASHLSDVMVTGMNRTKATLETFRMAVQYAGATAASLNVNFEELAAVASAASNAGLRASVVGTGLRATMAELISPTKKMSENLAAMGLSTNDVDIASRGLIPVLKSLRDAGLNASNAYDMFGRRAATFVLAAQGQLDKIDELQLAFIEQGATLKAYGKQMDTISAQATALGNTIKAMASDVLDSISWMIKGFLKGINSVLKSVRWAFGNKDNIAFQNVKEGFEETSRSTKAFSNYMDILKDRMESGENISNQLNSTIDKLNVQFEKTEDFVGPTENLADAWQRVKDVLDSIEEKNVEKINSAKIKRANQLMEEKLGLKEETPFDYFLNRINPFSKIDTTRLEFAGKRHEILKQAKFYEKNLREGKTTVSAASSEIEKLSRMGTGGAEQARLFKKALEIATYARDKVGDLTTYGEDMSSYTSYDPSAEAPKGKPKKDNEDKLTSTSSKIERLNKDLKDTNVTFDETETRIETFSAGFGDAIGKMAEDYTRYNLGSTIAEDLTDGMTEATYAVFSGTKSIKDAFADLAKSVMQEISKMLIKMAILQAFGGLGFKGGNTITESGGVTATSSISAANGGFIPKLKAAAGSKVRGGVPYRDSVPAMLMPGEYVLKKSAVDALGTNFLNDLNNNAAQTLTNTASSLMEQNPWEESNSEPSVVNVWVVSKEEEAKMGPNDVIATIGKDIMTGGQTRRLIQSVVAGRK